MNKTHEELKVLVKRERVITLEILEKLREIERTMHYAKLGYSSLYKYVHHELGYSEAEAYHRIQAMRVVKDLGEPVRVSFKEGKVTSTTLTQLSKATQGKSREEKLELFGQIQGKSKREVEKILEPEKKTSEFDQYLEAMRALYSHKVPSGDLREIFVLLAKEKLCSVSGPERRCSYPGCGSKFFVESDHIIPKGMGGTDHASNRRDLCRTHNQLAATQAYPYMQRYLPKLR